MVKLTDSELLFENFLNQHLVPFERVPVERSRRTPDYLMMLQSNKVAVEVTSLKGGIDIHEGGSWSRIVGDAIRREVGDKRSQLKWASEQQLPSLLLMFDSESPGYPRLLEDMDFETAMYGARTVTINRKTKQSGQMFNGLNRKMRPDTNTHISSLGRINYSFQGQLEVTIFPNLFADIRIESLDWPACFNIRKFEIEFVETKPMDLR